MYLDSFEQFKNYINDLEIKASEELMILVGENSYYDVESLIKYLNDKNIKFFGGVYSRLLIGDKCESTGFIIQKHEPIYSATVLPYLMRIKLDKETLRNSTAIILVDGLSVDIKSLTDTVYNKLGNTVKYIGGGAGFYDLKQRPCIFDNNGLAKDILHICIIKSDINISVEHGWNVLEGSFTVTESKDNTLIKLDNYPAFDVYKDIIEAEETIRLYKEDFFVYAKDHPFGIVYKNQKGLIVRDPIALNEYNAIVCVADIPEYSELYVLKGDSNTLLNSSLKIAEHCAKNAPKKYVPLLFDCISRAMFLEDRFPEELKNIQDKLVYPVEGALSIGEVSSLENGELVIHNKSTILGLLNVE
jgi:hypothetical protein